MKMFWLFVFALWGAVRATPQGRPGKWENAVEAVRLAEATEHVGYHPVKLKVNVTEIEGRSAWVRVDWSGVAHPSFDDFVAVMAPAHAKVKNTTPVKYKLAASDSSHLVDGSGSTTCDLPCRPRIFGVQQG
jgi:hypothetical protein